MKEPSADWTEPASSSKCRSHTCMRVDRLEEKNAYEHPRACDSRHHRETKLVWGKQATCCGNRLLLCVCHLQVNATDSSQEIRHVLHVDSCQAKRTTRTIVDDQYFNKLFVACLYCD